MKVLALIPYLQGSVPGQRFRIEQWARMLEPFGVQFDFVPFQSQKLRQVLHANGHYGRKIKELFSCFCHRTGFVSRIERQWDVVFLHRELSAIGPPVLERVLARRGIPIVYDFDDAIFLPDVSDANRYFKWAKWPRKTGRICTLSSHVIVGNQYLKEYVLRFTDRVSVVPTTIDTEHYTVKGSVSLRGRPVIGWSGSVTTLKHLSILETVLKTMKERIDFRLKVIGSRSFVLDGLDPESKNWSENSEIDDLKSFDIGIMPLPDDAWSRGKCGLKALQYMAVGVPTIVSPVGVNSEIVKDGHNGFLASNDKEWVEKLSLLISNENLRKKFSEEGRRTVEERYSGEVHALRVLKILESVRN